MLGQKQIAQYLSDCQGDCNAIEEVLSTYAIAKWAKGYTCSGVLDKFRHLCLYLRVTDRGDIIRDGVAAFRIIALEISLGGQRIGILPSMTPVGKRIVNDLRRRLDRSYFIRGCQSLSDDIMTDGKWGGPFPAASIMTAAQQRPSALQIHFSTGNDRTIFRSPGSADTPDIAPLYGSIGESSPEWIQQASLQRMSTARPEWAERYFITRPKIGDLDRSQPFEFQEEDLPEYLSRLSRLSQHRSEVDMV